MSEKLESNETGSVMIVRDTMIGSAIVAEDVASSENQRRAATLKHGAEHLQEQKQIDRDHDGQRKNQVRRAGIC